MEYKKLAYEVSLITPGGGTAERCNAGGWPARLSSGLLAKKKLGMVRRDRKRHLANDDAWLTCATRGRDDRPLGFTRYLRNGRKVELRQRQVSTPSQQRRPSRHRRSSCIQTVLREGSDLAPPFPRRRSSSDSSKLTCDDLHPLLREDLSSLLLGTLASCLRAAGVARDTHITEEQGTLILSHLYKHVSLRNWVTADTLAKEAKLLEGTLEELCTFVKQGRWREILADKWTPAQPGRCTTGHALWAMRCGVGPGKIGRDVRCKGCNKIGVDAVARCPPCNEAYCAECRHPPREVDAYSVLLAYTDDPYAFLPQDSSIISFTNDKLRRARLAESAHPSLVLSDSPSPSSVLAPASLANSLRDAMIVMFKEKPGDILDEVLALFSTTTPHGTTFNEFATLATLVAVWCGRSCDGFGLLHFAATMLTQNGTDLDRFLGYLTPPPLQDPESDAATWAQHRPLNPNHPSRLHDAAKRLVSVDSVQTLDAALEALRPYIKILVTLAAMAEPYQGVLSVPATSLDVVEDNIYTLLTPVMCMKGEVVPGRHTLHISSCNDVGVVQLLHGEGGAVVVPLSCFSVCHDIRVESEGSIVKAKGEQPFSFSPAFKLKVEEELGDAFARLKEIPEKGSVLRYVPAPGVEEPVGDALMAYTFLTEAA